MKTRGHVPRNVQTGQRTLLTCATCTELWFTSGLAQPATAKCTRSRQKLQTPSRSKFWQNLSPHQKGRFGKTWRLSAHKLLLVGVTKQGYKKRWVPELCEEGIEPNPGPTGPGSTLRFASLNTQGGQNAFRYLKGIQRDGIDFICLQEVNLDEYQCQQFLSLANQFGYRGWAQIKSCGGVITLLHRRLPNVKLHSINSNGGQFLTVRVADWALVNVYGQSGASQHDMLSACILVVQGHVATCGRRCPLGPKRSQCPKVTQVSAGCR